jgi:hypothetical protein
MHDLEQNEAAQGTLGGGWLGTYAYKGRSNGRPPVRFEATLTETGDGGRFHGTILDDDGYGEADVRGEVSGQGVRFSKEYRRRGLGTISYEGTLTEDGLAMAGTWRVSNAHGVWDARRVWSNQGLSAEDETVEDAAKETAEGWDKPRVREVVRLG